MLLGDIDTNGSLNAQMIHQFTNRLRGKMVIQVILLSFFFMLKSRNAIELILRITVAIKFHTFQGLNRIPKTFIKYWSSLKK